MESNTIETSEAVRALAALAQGTRLSIFRVLIEAGPPGMAAGAIASKLDIASPTLSFHLKELVNAGLIAPRQDGRFIVYRADYDAINALVAFLTENCCRASGVCMTECAPGSAAVRASPASDTATRSVAPVTPVTPVAPVTPVTPARRRAPAAARARTASTRRVR